MESNISQNFSTILFFLYFYDITHKKISLLSIFTLSQQLLIQISMKTKTAD